MCNSSVNGVYCLTSPSGKRYVGIAIRKDGIEGRWKEYKRFHCKEQPALFNALKKYGPENFKYEVILETNDVDNAKRSEMYLIDVWNLQDDKYGYNISDGGDHSASDNFKYSQKGRKWTDEEKKKLSIKKTGIKMSKEFGEKVSLGKKGKIPYSESKLKKNIKLINKITGEIKEGFTKEICKELGISNCNIHGPYGSKGWIILSSNNSKELK